MYLDIDEDFYFKKKDKIIILRNRYVFNVAEITKEKAREIIEFLTKFVEGE